MAEPGEKKEPGVYTERIASIPQRELTPTDMENLQQIPGVEINVEDAHPGRPPLVHVDQNSIVLPEKKKTS